MELSFRKPDNGDSQTPSGMHSSVEEDSNQSQRRGMIRFKCSDDGKQGPEKYSPETKPALPRYSPTGSILKDQTVVTSTSDPIRETDFHNPFDDPNFNPVLKSSHVTDPSRISKSYTLDFDSTGKIKTSNRHRDESSLAKKEHSKKTMEYRMSTPQRASFEDTEDEWQPLQRAYPARTDEVALSGIDSDQTYDGGGYSEDEAQPIQSEKPSTSESRPLSSTNANKSCPDIWAESSTTTPRFTPGQTTPFDEKTQYRYAPEIRQYRGGILSSLMKLYTTPVDNYSVYDSDTCRSSPTIQSPKTTNSKTSHKKNSSFSRLASVKESPHQPQTQKKRLNKGSLRSVGKRLNSSSLIDTAKSKLSARARSEDEIKITVHIAETLSRQNYLLKLCRALMLFGAPTHRLEEYMRMSARVLEIQGSFLYIPGCMIISFDDPETHTTEVKLVKIVQGINLGLLKDVHEIYKEVVHDVISVEEATHRLHKISNSPPKHNPWVLVIVHGLASASVAPFAFQGRYIDMPICFFLGCILGFLQLIIAPRSDLYNNVFEISAAVLTSFLARFFGSMQKGNIFCFSAMAQASIALILPGYIVLCGSLELQSRSMVAGSVRMVYAIIYSLFLGFGISIGTTIYGLLDVNATNATVCSGPAMSDYEKWPWVVVFTLCLCIINQAKWKQTPAMLFIGFSGYIVNFFSAKRFPSSAQISNTLGAFAVGMLGNLYSRMRHGVAAAALLPAIFVQVPSGLAASGSLLAGLSTAERITNSTDGSNGAVNINGTGSVGPADSSLHHSFHHFNPDKSIHSFTLALTVAVTSPEDLNTIVFNVGYSMIQIAIGITVGLFMSALLIYPFGKRRSGLFTF
ncbi:Uncharacterized UPF0442 protein C7D4.12c [Golovinomyces cichoracearum]|uniref:Uncharacterized UPF0442 protein C7D4.12c n=1 Tax=Golovinomyces cichoracearum TaxID=62708 RepID=A0A420HL53_9PEZI|nr:Uncharacterized UPF0442 protein C7D4.12c [Golovinomyces cichoracearum]